MFTIAVATDRITGDIGNQIPGMILMGIILLALAIWGVIYFFTRRRKRSPAPQFQVAEEQCLDDRAIADLLIADLEKMPDRDNPDVFWGRDGTTVNGLIEDLRQLTPCGRELVRLYRSAKETVAKGIADQEDNRAGALDEEYPDRLAP